MTAAEKRKSPEVPRGFWTRYRNRTAVWVYGFRSFAVFDNRASSRAAAVQCPIGLRADSATPHPAPKASREQAMPLHGG
jgi:hypothetical protein